MFKVLGCPSLDLNRINNLWQDLKLQRWKTCQAKMCKLQHKVNQKLSVKLSLSGDKQQQHSEIISLNKFYFFKNNWRKVLAISVQLFHHFLSDLLQTLNDQQGWEMLCCHIVHF